jgi:hypothetical protein
MKVSGIVLLTLLLGFSLAFAEGGKPYKKYSYNGDFNYCDNTNIRVDDGLVIITHRGYDKAVVEITDDYELSVNGQDIKLDSDQKQLVKEYYNLVVDINEEATQIGMEGAKIGLEGAKLGTTALKNVLKMFLTDYDSDDLERDMEKEAAKIEAKADALEKQADKIEAKAEELEEVAERLEDKIPELRNIIWY